jgi:hypothetical protein
MGQSGDGVQVILKLLPSGARAPGAGVREGASVFPIPNGHEVLSAERKRASV